MVSPEIPRNPKFIEFIDKDRPAIEEYFQKHWKG
jgi:hypothetical protein